MIEERFLLATQRIGQMETEAVLQKEFTEYFQKAAALVRMLVEEYDYIRQGNLQRADLEELKAHNSRLYAEILPGAYETSYADPAYAVQRLGEEYGRLLSYVYTQLRGLIPAVYEQQPEELVIHLELLLEMYTAFVCAQEETGELPVYEQIRQIVYWFVSDYSEEHIRQRNREQLDPACDFAVRIIMESDLSDLRYLYYFGEHITDSELRTAQHLAQIDAKQLQLMADTYTEGYRIGFEVGNKDLSKKRVVNIRYRLGFELMIRQAIQNFQKMGLQPTVYRAAMGSVHKIGYYGAVTNKQFEYDHKEDEALYLDKQMVHRRLEVMQTVFEQNKELAAVHAGPAVVETFGEEPFAPKSKPEALRLSEAQQKLSVEYRSAAGEMTNRYMKGEERSFTIIAFPRPEIGAAYEAIFDEVIRINTLDYTLYQTIQQTIIDTLNGGDYVQIKGMNGNKTDLCVALRRLEHPEREDVFENCVADVNIPVGEVFTSPQLEGTNGVLHVSRVFLNELEYKNLQMTFQDGMTTDYTCTNFEQEEENRKLIRDQVLCHHDSLPMGEFAIGTNTTAYVVAEKYQIADKLPILIAEKMGPHFAVGDTCYSHTEDVKIYNPNGKEIVAKDNTISKQRTQDPAKAYFNCHTDITIPYDELGELAVVKAGGERIMIIEKGRFVLKGCEELNLAFVQSENS